MEDIDGRIIILILFVVISAIKWLIEKIKGPINQPPAPEHDIPESLEDIYAELRGEIRQRQTKIQQPAEKLTPPPLPPSPTPQAPAQPIQHTFTEKPAPAILSDEQKAAAARFQQMSVSRKRTTTPQTYIRKILSSPNSTRQAIILTEILGKPKSLQDA